MDGEKMTEEVLGHNLREWLTKPRPTDLNKQGVLAAARQLFEPVPESLYEFADVSEVAKAIWESERRDTAEIAQRFANRAWAAKVFSASNAVEFACSSALREMERQWVMNSVIQPNLKVGDRTEITINGTKHRGIVESIDQHVANYHIATLAPVQGHEGISGWIVPFEDLDGLPSRATIEYLRSAVDEMSSKKAQDNTPAGGTGMTRH